MKKPNWIRVPLALAVLTAASASFAADHTDGPAAKADPAADITDVYSWVDGNNVILVMDVNPFATATSKFSDKVQYVFHTESQMTFGADKATASDVICTFDATQKISCWVGKDDYVTGDASATAGLDSKSGKVKVFAGLRDDPFYFNLDGFHAVEAAVEKSGPFMFDAAKCPKVDPGTSMALVTALRTDPKSMPPGGVAKDAFAGANVTSIVLSIDKSLLNKGGPVMSVWGSTNKGS